jgi:2-polyprenyl-3-methyl-5-hydroxy-6-metoxy-1,4-benzoquinol methylase
MRLQRYVDELFSGRPRVAILEAGCGSASHVGFGPAAVIVGIDLSASQLQRNDHLSEAIRGDIQTYPLGRQRFDAIICWDVLEHLPRPELAIENFARAVRPDGLIILKLPNLSSLKGLVTKLSPHWFHVWMYRHVLGRPNAGLEGHAPFPTFLRRSVKPRALAAVAARQGLAVTFLAAYESPTHSRTRKRYGIDGLPWSMVKLAVKAISLGRLSAGETDLLMALQPTDGTLADRRSSRPLVRPKRTLHAATGRARGA